MKLKARIRQAWETRNAMRHAALVTAEANHRERVNHYLERHGCSPFGAHYAGLANERANELRSADAAIDEAFLELVESLVETVASR